STPSPTIHVHVLLELGCWHYGNVGKILSRYRRFGERQIGSLTQYGDPRLKCEAFPPNFKCMENLEMFKVKSEQGRTTQTKNKAKQIRQQDSVSSLLT
ncbi:Uncharacterized protein APZ42_011371, partial [Daphnia magna]